MDLYGRRKKKVLLKIRLCKRVATLLDHRTKTAICHVTSPRGKD